MPFEGGGVQESKSLSYVKESQDEPTGYFRIKETYKFHPVFKNSYNGGIVRVSKDKFGNRITRASGDYVSVYPNASIQIMAIDEYHYSGTTWMYQNWTDDIGGNPNSANPQTRTITTNATYIANFLAAPPTPQNLRVTNTTYSAIHLAWDATNPPPVAYELWWQELIEPNPWTLVVSTGSTPVLGT